jgi:hypothetical protein
MKTITYKSPTVDGFNSVLVNDNSEVHTSTVFDRDEAGNIVKRTVLKYDLEKSLPRPSTVSMSKFEYDDKNRMTKEETASYTEEYYYSEEGDSRSTTTTHIDKSDSNNNYEEIITEQKIAGEYNVVKIVNRSKSGIDIFMFEYDNNGLLVKTTNENYDSDPEVATKSTVIRTERYSDSFGQFEINLYNDQELSLVFTKNINGYDVSIVDIEDTRTIFIRQENLELILKYKNKDLISTAYKDNNYYFLNDSDRLYCETLGNDENGTTDILDIDLDEESNIHETSYTHIVKLDGEEIYKCEEIGCTGSVYKYLEESYKSLFYNLLSKTPTLEEINKEFNL